TPARPSRKPSTRTAPWHSGQCRRGTSAKTSGVADVRGHPSSALMVAMRGAGAPGTAVLDRLAYPHWDKHTAQNSTLIAHTVRGRYYGTGQNPPKRTRSFLHTQQRGMGEPRCSFSNGTRSCPSYANGSM